MSIAEQVLLGSTFYLNAKDSGHEKQLDAYKISVQVLGDYWLSGYSCNVMLL